MKRNKRLVSPKGKHGRVSKKNGGEDKGWEGDNDRWDREFIEAVGKERARIPRYDETSEAEMMKICMLVAAKAKGFRIRADKAGRLAAWLVEDFHILRVQLMTDLIENPGILESIKRVTRGEGKECDETCDCGANQAEDRKEATEGKGEAADA